MATLEVSQSRRTGLLMDLKVFLDDVRLHDWAPGLPANATYYRGEIPRVRGRLPRFVDEFVMGQLERDDILGRLPDLTTRTAIVIIMETGLRSPQIAARREPTTARGEPQPQDRARARLRPAPRRPVALTAP